LTPPAQTRSGRLSLSLRKVEGISKAMMVLLKPKEPGAAAGLKALNGVGRWDRSSGGAARDDIRNDFILGDLLQTHVGMTLLRQPAFGGATVFSEIKQFGVAGVLLKDTHGADGGSFDDLKMEIAVN
jgi:hypothetical protein